MLAQRCKEVALSIVLLGLLQIDSFATHLRAGEIQVNRVGNGLTYAITITIFTNSGSTILFGANTGFEDVLDFGDGTQMQVPETQSILRPDLGPNIGVASFIVIHTYPAPGSYLISFREPNRNEGVINMDNSVTTRFYIETLIKIDPTLPYYGTPKSFLAPILQARAGEVYTESLAQVSNEDDQLIYQLVDPKSDRDLPVQNYRLPENLSIDPISGLLTWDTKFQGDYILGEFSFAVKTYQLRDGKLVGYMVRDFQIVVTDGEDGGEIIKGGEYENGRVYTPENSTTKLRVEAGSKVNAIDLKITSELEGSSANFSYTIEDSVHEDMFYKVAKILYTNSADIVRSNPYIITARATFDGMDENIRKDLVYVIATKDIYYEVPLILNTDEENVSKITIFPNPVQNFIHISNSEDQIVGVKIFDLNGRVHIQQRMLETSIIDVSHLPSGMYVCKLMVNGKMITHKIIKE